MALISCLTFTSNGQVGQSLVRDYGTTARITRVQRSGYSKASYKGTPQHRSAILHWKASISIVDLMEMGWKIDKYCTNMQDAIDS